MIADASREHEGVPPILLFFIAEESVVGICSSIIIIHHRSLAFSRLFVMMTSAAASFIGLEGLSASRDLSREWRSCCLRAGGWDEELLDSPRITSRDDDEEEEENNETKTVHVINLVANLDDDRDDVVMDNGMVQEDGWLAAVHEIEKNLNRMIGWLQEKKWTFSAVETPDDEASLIQSTIASYTASTANELEELRSVLLAKEKVDYQGRPQEFEHHNIIVQTLLQRLKEEVAEPFGKMQKQRQREAVKLWQNPLQVELYIPPPAPEDEMDAALGIAGTTRDPSNRKFFPQRRRHPLQANFMDSYEVYSRDPLEKPVSLFAKGTKRAASVSPVAAGEAQSGAAAASSSPPKGPLEKRSKVVKQNAASAKPSHNSQVIPGPQTNHNEEDNDLHYAQPQDLQQEAVLMKASLENDLDQVQKMETTMVNITNLLSQFADLVAGQQEDILHIHDAAETTKENVDKGQEKLLDAADKTQQSKHYMASSIFAMGVMLLVVHWIRP